jgi:hypothetical protein
MSFRSFPPIAWLTVLAGFCGELPAELPPPDVSRAHVLGGRIAALGPKVRREEAQRLAECAYATAAELRGEYEVIGPPLFNNFLINVGIRKRGLCYQWSEDLLGQLDALGAMTLELHWAEARAGSVRENNCIVVTAKGQPFQEGIVLDCWRHAGHLFWAPVAADHYPWVENRRYVEVARTNFAATTKPRAKRSVAANTVELAHQRRDAVGDR